MRGDSGQRGGDGRPGHQHPPREPPARADLLGDLLQDLERLLRLLLFFVFEILGRFFQHLRELFESGPRVFRRLLQALLHFLRCFGRVHPEFFSQLAKLVRCEIEFAILHRARRGFELIGLREILRDFLQTFVDTGGVEISLFELVLNVVQHLGGLLRVDLAFLKLIDDQGWYDSMVRACPDVAAPFLDREHGLISVLKKVLGDR